MAFTFVKLLVYQKSVDFADQICDLTEQFPARYNHLADQFNRASLSISSNIAQGKPAIRLNITMSCISQRCFVED